MVFSGVSTGVSVATGAGEGPLGNKKQQGSPGLALHTTYPGEASLICPCSLIRRPSPDLRGTGIRRPGGGQGQHLTAHLILFILLQTRWSQ